MVNFLVDIVDEMVIKFKVKLHPCQLGLGQKAMLQWIQL